MTAPEPPSALFPLHLKQVDKAHYAQTFRAEQAEMVAAVLEKYDVDEQSVPPMAVAFLMTVIPPVLFMEDQLDITAGHAEIVELVERYLRKVEGEPTPR